MFLRVEPERFEWPSAEVTECPFPFYAALRERGPVYRNPGTDEHLVSRWEDIAYVEEHPELFTVDMPELATLPKERGRKFMGLHLQVVPEERARRFADDPMNPRTIPVVDPPEHGPKRALTLGLVHRDRLASYEPMIRRLANELIDTFVDRGAVDFYAEFAEILPVRVILEVMGLPREDFELCKRLSDIAGLAGPPDPDERRAYVEALDDEANAYMARQLLDRLERPRDDFLGEFVHAQVERDGELSLGFLAAQAYNLLFAGNITTTHMLASAMLLLLEHPETLARVRADRSLLRPMLEEVLRLESPIQFTWRRATQDTEVGGVPIAAGTRLVLFYGSGNRDERCFADPEAFRIDRPRLVKDSLAFGRGIHLCMGAPLARLEGQLAFEELFARLDNLRFADEDDEIRHLEVASFRSPTSLRVAFEPAAAPDRAAPA
jgi:cytochrome P450